MSRKKEEIDAIKQLVEDWSAGWHAGDAKALLSFYVDDPVLMPQNQLVLVGKEAIRSTNQSFLDEFSVEGEAKLIEIEVAGDWR